MQFRSTSRSTAHRVARYSRIRVLVIAILIGMSLLADGSIAVRIWRLHHEAAAGYASLVVTGVPTGTEVVVGNLVRGYTPAVVRVPAGDQRIQLNHHGYMSSARWLHSTAGQALTLDDHLWRQRPDVLRLQPVFPGAAITDAMFLHDGQLVLTVTMPSETDRQFWLVDGTGGTRRLDPPDLHGAVALSPDGTRIAALAPDTTSLGTPERGAGPSHTIWTVDTDGKHARQIFALPSSPSGEHLIDASWSPNGRRLLAISTLPLPGGTTQRRLVVLDLPAMAGPTQAQNLITIPSDIVIGSARWSPDGAWVALMTHTDRVISLVLVNTISGAFRYLADVGTRDVVSLPFNPVDWTPDSQRLVYAAPNPEPSITTTSWFVSSKASAELFTFATDTRAIHRVGATEARSPAWRTPDHLLAFTTPRGTRGLLLRSFDPDGTGQDQTILPISIGSTVTARWDVALALLVWQSSAVPACADEPAPAATPIATTAAPAGNPAPSNAPLFSFPDPKQWAADVFSQVLVTLLRGLADALRTVATGVMGSSLNFITQTPAAGSYASPTVLALWGVVRDIANAGLVLVVVWGGFNVIVRQQTGATYHDVMELLPRLMLGAVLVNTSLWWAQFAIDVNNALCQAIGQSSLPAWERADTASQLLMNVIAALIYLVTSLILVLQMLTRLALVDMLLVIAPLGLLCWVLPQTESWARRWCSNFFNTVFTQVLQVVTLKLGGSLLTDLTPQSPDAALLGVFLGVAVLLLTLKLPGLMRTHVGEGLGLARFYVYRQAARAMEGRGAAAASKTGGQ